MTENVKKLPQRDQVPAELKWDVASVFANDDAWEAAFAEAEALPEQAAAYAGTLAQSPEHLAEYLELRCAMLQKLDKLFLYAQMKRDEDNANHLYQGLADRAQNLGVRVSAALAFEAPELLSISSSSLVRMWGFWRSSSAKKRW